MSANKVIDLIKKPTAYKMAAGTAAGGAAVGGIVGYMKGKKDGKKSMKKKAESNIYLDKLAASVGAVGKALIRTKLAPAMSNMSKSTASRVEGISRAMGGSKVMPNVYSAPEQAQHMSAMHNLGRKLMPNSGGMDPNKTNKVMAVAARARRMQLSKAGQ